MKHRFILIFLVVLTFSVATPREANAWFGDSEKQHRIQAEQQLYQQQQQTGKWEMTSFILGIGCILMLVGGAAIGSKGRTNAKRKK